MSKQATKRQLARAVDVLHGGGVLAYPTEYCFGLGCDPRNPKAIMKLLAMKQRQVDQGMILIAADTKQASVYCRPDDSPLIDEIEASWPGPTTWLLPAQESVTKWVRGKHSLVAMRVTAHPVSRQLCLDFGGAIVSTSANRHGARPGLTAEDVRVSMGSELDYILDTPVGTATSPSTIRDGLTGRTLR